MGDFIPVTLEDIPKILEIAFTDEEYYTEIKCKLILLAIDFCSELQTVRDLKKDFVAERITPKEAMSTILKSWIGGYAHNGGKAPFEEFVDALFPHGLTTLGARMVHLLADLSVPKEVEELKRKESETKDQEDANVAPIHHSLAQEQALNNTVILEEIYKNLSFRDGRKEFQLVNKVWRSQGLRLWRKSSVIRVCRNKSQERRDSIAQAHMQEFVELCKEKKGLDSNGEVREDEEDSSNTKNEYCCKLLEHPYRSYIVDMYHPIEWGGGHEEEDVNAKANNEKNQKVCEHEFWKMCGPPMEFLCLTECLAVNSASEEPLTLFKNVLLGFCPNLKELQLDINRPNYGPKALICEPQEFPEGKFAERLESLIIPKDRKVLNVADYERIFQICPNLKSLVVQCGGSIGKLLKPAVNGKFIELQRLKVTSFDGYPDGNNPQLLRSYVEKFPEALKHLQLGNIDLDDTRSNRSNFFAALGQCRNLQSLQLEFRQFFRQECGWFMDLSIFSFPHLLKLKVRCNCLRGMMKPFFDFGTLKGMPNIEELSIYLINEDPSYILRKPGTDDWIYEGRRDLIVPDGVKTNYVYAEKEPILCESLKKLCFYGWEINAEDVSLISKWTPNLTYLFAVFTSDAIPGLLDSWGKLERLDILSTGFVPLRLLRPLKETKKNLEIVVRPYITLNWEFGSFEVKEFNGRVYYDWENWNEYE